MSTKTTAVSPGAGGRQYARFIHTLWMCSNIYFPAINTLSLVPIQIPFRLTINRLGTVVNTNAGNLRMGIYTDNGGLPDGGALLTECGPAAVANIGKFEIALPAPYQLQRGLYWIAQVNDDAAYRLLGSDLYQQQNGTINGRSVAHPFGALPNPCPVTAVTGAAGCPINFCLVSSVP